MNFEQKYSEEHKTITERRLLKACQKFANILADGQWFEKENQKISISRKYTELIGGTGKVEGEKVSAPGAKIRTRIDFVAKKELISEHDDGYMDFQEVYLVHANVKMPIDYTDVPGDFLDNLPELIDDFDDDGLGDEGEDEGSLQNNSISNEEVLEYIKKVKFHRELMTVYEIDDEGNVANYAIAARYIGDGAVIGEEEYSWDVIDTDLIFMPTSQLTNEKGEPIEKRRINQPRITEEDITIFLDTLDAIMETAIDSKVFDEIGETMHLPDDEHSRRAMAIIAMAGIGFKGMKKI